MIKTGLEVCRAAASADSLPEALRAPDLRIGVLLNDASLGADHAYAHTVLDAALPGSVSVLFGPQHGIWRTEQDNMVETAHGTDPLLQVPVFSLYSETRTLTPPMLDAMDVLVVDLQDVGTRVYTYVWTLRHCMAVCAQAGVPVVVLDRPNPIGGIVAEGPLLGDDFQSFVGEAPIPMRHGLTLGELARLLNGEQELGCDLHVVPMDGWKRGMHWPDTGLPWLPPSPNLPRFEGTVVYPGQVLIEGTELSEGRGTTTPFELVGAPWLDGFRLIAELDPDDFEGLTLRPTAFVPTFQKHADQTCGGLFWHVTDARKVRSYRSTVALLQAIQRLWPADFAWRPPPYEYEEELMPIDILTGGTALRALLDGTADRESVLDLDKTAWWQRVEPFLLY